MEPYCAIQSLGNREQQEDSYGILYDSLQSPHGDPTCFILADGMGGHLGGSIASQIVVDSTKASLSEETHFNPSILEHLASSSNEDLRRFLDLNPDCEGMGTTLTVLFIHENRIYWVSVGDSPLFSISADFEITRLNADHSMKPIIEEMRNAGLEDSDDSSDLKSKGFMLRSAIQGKEIQLVDVAIEGVSTANIRYLVLCSDGIETLTQEQIASTLQEMECKNLNEIAISLVDKIDATGRNSQDNVTAIIIDIANYSSLSHAGSS